MPETMARTPLYDLHVKRGAKMVPFAGYDMPVQYPGGIMAEHLHTRSKAGLFDVSHMGQARLPAGSAKKLETLVPGDILGLGRMRTRYTLFTNERGGILDDLMVTNADDHIFVVVNAAGKAADFAHLERHIDGVEPLDDRALLALQGPSAAAVLARLSPGIDRLTFMTATQVTIDGAPCFVTRSGYTGEDGFEISCSADAAVKLAERLLKESEVALIGLGARDSLRLEAGLCLYGHDIDEETTPIEADLAWAVAKRRREEGGFPGAAVVLKQLKEGVPRKRVGLQPEGRAPAREGTEIVVAGEAVGRVTSGGFGATAGGPVAMGYVATAQARPGTAVELVVRGTPRPARIVPLPFVPHRYHRG
jgi:aminomethyltransferase